MRLFSTLLLWLCPSFALIYHILSVFCFYFHHLDLHLSVPWNRWNFGRMITGGRMGRGDGNPPPVSVQRWSLANSLSLVPLTPGDNFDLVPSWYRAVFVAPSVSEVYSGYCQEKANKCYDYFVKRLNQRVSFHAQFIKSNKTKQTMKDWPLHCFVHCERG